MHLRIILCAALAVVACKEKKHITNAKSNAAQFGQARCSCEKQKQKEPPGDLTKCSEDMARTTRYLKINMEFNAFSEADKAEIQKAGDLAFKQCMAAAP